MASMRLHRGWMARHRWMPALILGALLAPGAATVFAANADDGSAPVAVPDDIGLGERLALVAWLNDHGAPPADPQDLPAMRRAFLRLNHVQAGAPATMAAAAGTPGTATAAAPAPTAAEIPAAATAAAPVTLTITAGDAAPTLPHPSASTAGAAANEPAPGSRRARIYAGLRKEGIEPNPELGDDQLALLLAHLEELDTAAANDPTPTPAGSDAAADPASASAAAPAGQTRGPTPIPATVLPAPGPGHDGGSTLLRARLGFTTNITTPQAQGTLAVPPGNMPFSVIKYPADPGPLAAYLSKDPGDGGRHPAIVWITGGDCNSIDDIWSPCPPDNDQSAAQYRAAGMVMMFPSLRGGNDNPGRRESFYGEVDDVIAAGQYLATLPDVDPNRIYLGGHSTGGTLALLVAECSHGFAGIFCFGPVRDVSGYGGKFVYYDTRDPRETELRSPIHWLDAIITPTYVFEGANRPSNAGEVLAMAQANHNALLHIYQPIPGQSHFSVLEPLNTFLANWVIAGTGAPFTDQDLAEAAKGGR